MATADFGAIDICGLLSLSPLIDLLRACIVRFILAALRVEANELRDILLHCAIQRRTCEAKHDRHEEQKQRKRGEEISGLMAHLHRRTSCL